MRKYAEILLAIAGVSLVACNRVNVAPPPQQQSPPPQQDVAAQTPPFSNTNAVASVPNQPKAVVATPPPPYPVVERTSVPAEQPRRITQRTRGDRNSPVHQGVSFQTFYDQLGDQGTWMQTDNYGYVFQPNITDPDWAPYTQGHWVNTDAGWTWVSNEPWGWATYHYGRWANIEGTGWVWVPGYRWAPAWVSWRYGGGYAGWAPLPPETLVDADYGDRGDHGQAQVPLGQ